MKLMRSSPRIAVTIANMIPCYHVRIRYYGFTLWPAPIAHIGIRPLTVPRATVNVRMSNLPTGRQAASSVDEDAALVVERNAKFLC